MSETTMTTDAVLAEVLAERARQDAKWGEQNHPDVDRVLTDRQGGCNTRRMAEEYGIPTARSARSECNCATDAGQCTWAHIAVEELCEAVEAATDAQQGRKPISALRQELVQLAAVVVAWIEAIDRREPPDAGEVQP